VSEARYCQLGLLVTVLIAFGIRVAPIAERPLWFDEADTWIGGVHAYHDEPGKSYATFMTWTHDDENAPLGYLLPRLSVDLFGTEAAWALRLPSVIFGTLCVAAGYVLGWVVHSRRVGLLVAMLIAVDPNMVDQSQQARMYTMLMCFTLAAATWTMVLLRDPTKPRWHWLGLGVALAGVFWSTPFGVMVWVGIALGVWGLLIAGWLTRRPHAKARRVILGFTASYIVAAALSVAGLLKTFGKTSGPGDAAGMSLQAIAVEVATAMKDLINLTPAGLLVYPLALLGLFAVLRHCRTSTAVLVGLAAANLLILVPFRRQHHFMDPRYLSVIQPALWVGLAMLPVLLRSVVAERAALAVLFVYLGLQTWQCLNIERYWQQPERHEIGAMFKHSDLAEGEVVIVHPQVLEQLGRYYGVRVDPAAEQGLYELNRLREQPQLPANWQPKAVVMYFGMINYEGRRMRALRTAGIVLDHFGHDADEQELRQIIRVNQPAMLRVRSDAYEHVRPSVK